MSKASASIIKNLRSFLAEFFIQILAFGLFVASGLAWVYFETYIAAIIVMIFGIIVGTYLYNIINGSND